VRREQLEPGGLQPLAHMLMRFGGHSFRIAHRNGGNVPYESIRRLLGDQDRFASRQDAPLIMWWISAMDRLPDRDDSGSIQLVSKLSCVQV
jgi:hypothetical protein